MKLNSINCAIPVTLTNEEQLDPQMVLQEFFDFAHLSQVQTMLWQWLTCTLTGNIATLNVEEREVIILLYEKLEKLIEASSILNNLRISK